MSDKIDIYLLDNSNNPYEEINLKKPNSYQELLTQLKQKSKNLPEIFTIFYFSDNNQEISITNNEEYKRSKDILFVRKKEENNLEYSIFALNYDKLSESKQEMLDEKYNCFICQTIIKNEKPYFCYICQKIFHHKCLEDWNKKKSSQNEKLNCPNCRNELPLEQWKQKLDFEANRKNEAQMMSKMNEYKLNNNLNNNMNIIKDKKINQLKSELKEENIKKTRTMEEYTSFIQTTCLVIKNILNKINRINLLINPEINDKIIYLISELSQKNFMPNLNKISSTILDELEVIYKYIKRIADKENLQKEKQKRFENMHEYRNEITVNYFTTKEGAQTILGKEFVQKNRDSIELMIKNKKNVLSHICELREGENFVKILIKKKLYSLDNMFKDCKILRNIKELQYLETKDVTDFSYMFWGCSSLSDISSIRYWYVNSGKNFQSMFGGCVALHDISPLKHWQVSNGTNFSAMFFNCSSLSDITPLKNWNVSNGINFSGMFSKCRSLYDLNPLQNWNVSKGKYFSAMFFECSLLSDISPFQKWNVSKEAIFSRMFCETKLLPNAHLLQNWKIPEDKFKDLFM